MLLPSDPDPMDQLDDRTSTALAVVGVSLLMCGLIVLAAAVASRLSP